jgi:hypothetical protein
MATRMRPRAGDLYKTDFYARALTQADLLRRRQFDAVDLDNLIDEVEGLATPG